MPKRVLHQVSLRLQVRLQLLYLAASRVKLFLLDRDHGLEVLSHGYARMQSSELAPQTFILHLQSGKVWRGCHLLRVLRLWRK